MSRNDSPFRRLPAVHELIDRPELVAAAARVGRAAVLASIRAVLDRARESIRNGTPVEVDPARLALRALAPFEAARATLRAVVNATGVLLHTGLGRAPLAAEAVEAVAAASRGYCDLEFDLETGGRGRRVARVAERLRELVGCEAATVVNNNAAATVLALRALAKGREVVVSRGQLVEIGGGFRLPEIFEVSGARLREVGTTNRTRLDDYGRAIGPETAALLRVHPSNFGMYGFVESVGIAELAALARSRGIAVIDDVGSGLLDRDAAPGMEDEPTVRGGIAAGADLVLFSGDKLLGGPQCGLIVGRADAVAKVERDPLMRAFRVDKLTIAALDATLALAADSGHGRNRLPTRRFLFADAEALRRRAEALASRIRGAGFAVEVVASTARIGGGGAPSEELPSWAVAPTLPGATVSELARRLRVGTPSVVARVHAGRLLLDLRAVDETEEDRIVEALVRSRTPVWDQDKSAMANI